MQEFSSVSASTYEPDALVGQLNERSAAGWDVVAVVTTGTTVTAYLSRDADADAAPATTADTAAAAAPVDAADTAAAGAGPDATATGAAAEPAAAEPAADEPFMPTTEAATAGAAAAAAAEPAAAEPAAAEPAAAEPAAAAPAGWYADPSSRFELRYWDGSTWTEHVSRGGQQFTDPPVA